MWIWTKNMQLKCTPCVKTWFITATKVELKLQSPWHALAMAVRQISGCSGLIHILNGLGHCVSLSSTMAYDSAIAQLVIETSDIVPREFVSGQSINLVYDNIDFGEEVKKQTHVTNGIITHKDLHSYQITSERETVNIKKSQRMYSKSA